MTRLIPITGLIVFFLILAERITVEAILIGLAVSVFALKANKRRAESSYATVSTIPLFSVMLWPYWMRFVLTLIREIILANLQVAIIILSRNMPIQPKIYSYETKLTDERLIVVLANSITLTPGTMTVDLHNGELTVHALTKKYFKGLSTNPVEKILLRMEEKLYG